MSALLSVRNLRVAYGGIEALHGIDLDVQAGEIVALIGANGAGKSTALGAISGLLRASSGSIRFDDTEVAGWPAERISRRGMALTPEGRRVFAHLTVDENLMLGGAAHGDRDSRAARRRELLALFPILSERARQRAGTLSGGEQQMLAIARSLMSRPKLLLLDEPSLGLAPRMIDGVFAAIETLKRAGLTVLLVEQNVVRALEISDRAFVLANGAVVLSGDALDLAGSEQVRDAYLGTYAA
jgi:branched-chain amino acid transport system ATP-binding protein